MRTLLTHYSGMASFNNNSNTKAPVSSEAMAEYLDVVSAKFAEEGFDPILVDKLIGILRAQDPYLFSMRLAYNQQTEGFSRGVKRVLLDPTNKLALSVDFEPHF